MKMMNKIPGLITCSLILAFSLCCGPSEEEIQFNSIDNYLEYEKFIEAFPEGKFFTMAQSKVRNVSFTLTKEQEPMAGSEIVIFPVAGEKIINKILGYGTTDEKGFAVIPFYNPNQYMKYALILHNNSFLTMYDDEGNALLFSCDNSRCDIGTVEAEFFGTVLSGN